MAFVAEAPRDLPAVTLPQDNALEPARQEPGFRLNTLLRIQQPCENSLEVKHE
jgi:hypothetical protein